MADIFKDYIKNARTQTGLTQVNFAILIKVPVDTYRAWEQGKQVPSLETIVRAYIDKIVEKYPDAKERVHFHKLEAKETAIRADESVSDILEVQADE